MEAASNVGGDSNIFLARDDGYNTMCGGCLLVERVLRGSKFDTLDALIRSKPAVNPDGRLVTVVTFLSCRSRGSGTARGGAGGHPISRIRISPPRLSSPQPPSPGRQPPPHPACSKQPTGGRQLDMDLAPQDVLAEVLRRLAPRSLAACRCVCKGWRAVVDANGLLRADLLPLTLDAIFYETCPYNTPMLFSSPATGRRVTGKLDYLDWPLNDVFPIMDCCNGLLLMCYHVVNPATRQWVRLPPLPPSCTAAGCTRCSNENRYLVYDPALSPHYEVFLIPNIPFKLPTGHICMHICGDDESVPAMEWPPSPYIVHVFSSKTGCWKERSLLREGEAAGTVADVKAVYDTVSFFLYAAYWKDALYVRCEEEFLLR
ncbi:hypothetical protein TRIUR3_24818 [Triticum urartu]|uniref:Uncharacterized protein n=1 Tax=Triticum urartu TaxID=4572 RepID=M7YHY8_TRIUA|nr:hypothetical protein TRIUR3_24818 [Triticum urartu]